MKTEKRVCVINTSDIEAHHSELTDLEFIHIARKREGVYTLSQFAEEFNKGVLSGLSIENDYIRIIDIEISTIKNYDLVTAIYIADEEGYDHLLQQVGKIEHDLDWDELSKGKTVWNTKIGSITIELQESDGVKVLCYIDDKDNGETCFAFENDVGYIVSCTLDAVKRLYEQVTQVTSKIVAEDYFSFESCIERVKKGFAEVSKDVYCEMFGCVPPVKANNCGFVNGEPYMHNSKREPVYMCFWKISEKFYGAMMTEKGFNTVTKENIVEKIEGIKTDIKIVALKSDKV